MINIFEVLLSMSKFETIKPKHLDDYQQRKMYFIDKKRELTSIFVSMFHQNYSEAKVHDTVNLIYYCFIKIITIV